MSVGTNFRLEVVRGEDIGKFFRGDSYIVLNTEKVGDELLYDVHFWIGRESTAILTLLLADSCFEFQMFFTCKYAALALPIRPFISSSDPPCSSMMLPRFTTYDLISLNIKVLALFEPVDSKLSLAEDEYGTAAYKTVELDTFLDDKAVQHREVDGFESDLFKTYFNRFE
ncbi:unnamed protein product [Schistosoma curassoni]|uniref:Gelsolin-like domain-containing protein n=1 Tax=Schistosoma curassoni TaxID=6186 RepID=A0A183K1E1_9TREM|nr:unnamed protein product [Schistosoma curassoni]